jgi:hypothetical protein
MLLWSTYQTSKIQFLFPGKRVSAVHLRPSCDAGLRFVAPALMAVVPGHVLGQQRPWPDQTHLTFDNVDQLWQLIEACGPQRLGAAGRAFVGQRFAEQTVSKLVAAEYRRLLASALPAKRLDPARSRPGSPLGKALKRALDVVAASFGLVACSPLLLLIAIVLRRNTRSTALFRQNRIGLEGRPFVLYKFRTMTEARCKDAMVWMSKPSEDMNRIWFWKNPHRVCAEVVTITMRGFTGLRTP